MIIWVDWKRFKNGWVYTHRSKIWIFSETCSLLFLLKRDWYKAISRHWIILVSPRFSTFASLILPRAQSDVTSRSCLLQFSFSLLSFRLCWLYDIPDAQANSRGWTESTWEITNYGRFINQFPSNIIRSIRQFERINKKICKQKMSIMFNQICINEEMLPISCVYHLLFVVKFFICFISVMTILFWYFHSALTLIIAFPTKLVGSLVLR